MEEMGLIVKGNEAQTRWSWGLTQWPFLLSWASTKYELRIHPPSPAGLPADSIATFGNVKVYQNRFFLPLGFSYDKYIPMSDFLKLPTWNKVLTLYQAAVVEDPVDSVILNNLTPFNIKDTSSFYTLNELVRDVTSLKKDTLSITSFSENRIEGTIKAERPKMLFFSIPHDRGWHATIDQMEVKPRLTNIGFIGLVITPGIHKIALYYKPPYFNISIIISFIGLLIFAVLVATSIILKNRKKIIKSTDSSLEI
jgi:hypothetical protein